MCRLGTIGVASGTWNRPRPLSRIEWKRVRTVPYLTERVLRRQPRLADVGAIAGMVYERQDGSGYPRGLSGGAIPPPARILAAAEVYQALGEARPHRATRRPTPKSGERPMTAPPGLPSPLGYQTDWSRGVNTARMGLISTFRLCSRRRGA